MILDTNALSALGDGDPDAARQLADSPVLRAAIPVIVLGEYRFGIAHSRQRLYYEKWLGQFTSFCAILHVTEETAVWYATIRGELKQAGSPVPSNDTWIAALCRQHSLPILSRDRHFDRIAGIKRLSW